MHKDPRPGIVEIGARSVRYTVGLGVISGLLLSIVIHVGILIWNADVGATTLGKKNTQALEASMTARRRTPPPTPAATAAMRY
ncbi:MAG: hypothetical protein ACR2HH_12555 [Chthoniobacterales bacterium]